MAYYKKTKSVDEFIELDDTDVITALKKAAKDPKMAGHSDAKCVIYRQHRFRAVSLPDSITLEHLKQFMKEHDIKAGELEWEFAQTQTVFERLNFPVSRRHFIIQKAKDCSDLLVKVPGKKHNWVYICPEYDMQLAHFLENV